MRMRSIFLLGITVTLVTMLAAQSERDLLASLPEYKPGQTASGTIRIWGHGAYGHDFIQTLVTKWEDGFRRYQPGVHFDNKLYGTASAMGALYAGAGDLALLGREIWPGEITAFQEVFHYPPTGVEILTGSYDVRNKDFALIVYTHKDNPLSKLSLEQVDAVFGCEHRRGPKNIRTWGELGLKGEWADKPIRVYGFGISRGFSYFFEQTVFKGSSKWNPEMAEFSDEKQADGSLLDAGKRVLDALAKDPYGIAYSSALYANHAVKPLALAAEAGAPAVAPGKETVQDRSYPLTRAIPMFLNRHPGQPVDPKIREFLRYILSRQGQQPVLEDKGYLPLTGKLAKTERTKLD
jgi:phosphate transport system substrate-binding protein